MVLPNSESAEELFAQFDARFGQRIAAMGFTKVGPARYQIDFTANVAAWIGLNRSSSGPILYINPVVGIVDRRLEELVAELTGEPVPGLPNSWMGNIGYVHHDVAYKQLQVHTPKDIPRELNRLLVMLEDHVLASLWEFTDPSVLPGYFRDRKTVPIGMRRTRAPLASYLAGDFDEAEALLARELSLLENKGTETAIRYRRFAENLRTLLAASPRPDPSEAGDWRPENPYFMHIELITYNGRDDEYTLHLPETRSWDSDELVLPQLRDKIDTFAGYVTSGRLRRSLQTQKGSRHAILVDCVDAPTAEVLQVVSEAAERHAPAGIRVILRQRAAPQSDPVTAPEDSLPAAARVEAPPQHAAPESAAPEPAALEPAALEPAVPGPAAEPEARTPGEPMEFRVFADGGIARLGADTRDPAMATSAQFLAWCERAKRDGRPIVVKGAVDAPISRRLLDRFDDAGYTATYERSPAPRWTRGRTALMPAAEAGLDEHVTDLIDRGAQAESRIPANHPYRLAMRRGHIEVMHALRRAGLDRPSRVPPPSTLPEAIVLRPYLAIGMWLIPLVVLAVGAVGAMITLNVLALGVSVVLAGTISLILAAANISLAANAVAVDGAKLASRRNRTWHGPVDLRHTLAVGYLPILNWRSPARLRFGHLGDGQRISRLTTDGFDAEQVELLRSRDARCVTVNLAPSFLSPGILIHAAKHLPADLQHLSVSVKAVLAPWR